MTTATQRKTWVYNLGPVTKIPEGEGQVFQVGSIVVAVFRVRGDGVYATQALCPHKAGPLADGLVGAGQIICPLHGHTFDVVTGEPLGNACSALKTHVVHVNDSGDILLRLDD